MQIKEIRKGKKNTYELTLENQETFLLYDDILVKYSLLPKKEISEKELKQIKEENNNLKSYYVALDYLNRKMRTKKELEKLLSKAEFSKKSIQFAIQKLEEMGYLNEKIYAQSYLHDTFAFTNDGPLKITRKLTDLGLQEQVIQDAMQMIEKEAWQEKLNHIIEKKARGRHTDGPSKWKLKCLQYGINLGYPKAWVTEAIEKLPWQEDQELLKREKEKLIRKLSRKYSGSELEFQVQRHLYNKGFHNQEE